MRSSSMRAFALFVVLIWTVAATYVVLWRSHETDIMHPRTADRMR